LEKIKKEVLARVAKWVDKWLISKSRLYRKHFGFDEFFHVAKATEAESIVTSVRLPNNPNRRLGRGFYTFGSQQEAEDFVSRFYPDRKIIHIKVRKFRVRKLTRYDILGEDDDFRELDEFILRHSQMLGNGIPLTSTRYDVDILTAPWMGENFGYREIVFRTVRAIEALNASERAILG
jgi:hypothetical protein